MYVVVNRISVADGKSAEFETAFAGTMRDHLPGVPGLVSSTLLKPKNGDDPYVSTMEFVDPDSFQAWLKSDSFRAAHDVALDSTTGSTIEIYDVLESVSGT